MQAAVAADGLDMVCGCLFVGVEWTLSFEMQQQWNDSDIVPLKRDYG